MIFNYLTNFSCDNQDIRLQIWDTAGQEEFDSMTRSYYRGAHMCVLVFSATDRHSFESLLAWKHKVKNECENDIMMVMVMNKMDLSDKFEVDRYEAEHVARMLGMKMFRTSVKNNSNIDQVFNYLVDEYMSSGQIKNKQVFHKSIASIGNKINYVLSSFLKLKFMLIIFKFCQLIKVYEVH